MNKVQIWLVGTLFLTACANPPAFDLPDDPDIPEEWGIYGSSYISDTECPVIGGEYLSVPEIYITGGMKTFSEGDEYSFVTLFPFDLATKRFDEPPTRSQARSTFEVRQDNNQIVLTHVWANGQFLQTSIFSSFEGDFACVDGYIEFPISEHFGQIEGTSINGQVRRRVRKAENGSLIIVRSFGPSRVSLKTENIELSHQYFRFKKREM